MVHHTAHVLTLLRLEEVEKQLYHRRCGENLEFVGILDVHHLIAYVIGRLYDVDKRMTGVAQRLVVVRETLYTKFFGDSHIIVFL